ncbi:potassium channel family protein [Haloplanus sp. C73]|uniref:potassium channel family protein n=1 Tax=Haloplanus sp. C73 TaxID=3421641 RepID=UPI003EBEF31C
MPTLPTLTDLDLSRRDRLIVYYVVGLATLVLVYAAAYNTVLARLEGVDQSIFASFEFVVQTMTTTGYGQDSGLWSHPLTFLFVSFVQLSGIGIGFFTLRLIIIPLFTDAEVNLDDRLSRKRDHVIICGYRRDSAVLLDELTDLDIDYVLVSESEEDAKDLSGAGYAAIHGAPEDRDTFERASIDSARTVIMDAGDANVNAILTVRALDPDIEIIALTDDSDMRDVLLDAGADSVLSPHGVLGRRLAEKAVSSFSTELTDTVDLGPDVEVAELLVGHGSRLAGTRLRDSNLRERTGANVIGAWIDGDLQLPPDPDAVIQPNTVLLVSGDHDALEALSEFTRPIRSRRAHDRIIVAGGGEVGQAAASVVESSGFDAVTIDTEAGEEIDIVGDAASRATLHEADIEQADAVIVGLPDDSDALLTTVLARSIDPDIDVLVRVTDTDATGKALSAGADYVLSVPRVSARMVARELRGEDVLAPASQVRIVRVPAEPFAGSTLAESAIHDTDCRVVAIEDADSPSGRVDPNRELDGDERLTIVGTDEAVQRFRERFGISDADRLV